MTSTGIRSGWLLFCAASAAAAQTTPPQNPGAAGDDASGPTVLLVAIAKDERAARIAAFLERRGFRPTVTTYASATKEECDARDVVLLDSPTFDQVKGVRKHALAFPETATPMVAVGYLGTQVLEAQKVAMACGYI